MISQEYVVQEGQAELRHLYDISKRLTRFDCIEQTVPDVLALASDAVPLNVAILILEDRSSGRVRSRTIVWQAEGVSASRLRAAKAHAKRTYASLVVLPLPGFEEEEGTTPLPPTIPPPPGTERRQGFVLLPLVVEKGSIFGALEVDPVNQLDEAGLAFVNAVVNQLAVALDRNAIVRARQEEAESQRAEAERNEESQRFVAEISALLMSSLDYEKTLIAVARAVVPRLADVCLVDEIADDGRVRRLEVVLADPSKRHLEDLIRQFVPAPGWQLIEAGESVLIAEVSSLGRITDDPTHATLLSEVGVQSMMSVPLVTRGRTLGALTFMAAESGRRYSTSDLELARKIGYRAALAIDNAQLYERAEREIRARQDLLAAVSHDLGNPLANIVLSAEFLTRSIPPGSDWDRMRARSAAVGRSAEQMRRLISDLLDLASIEAGHFSLDRKVHEIGPLIQEAIEVHEPTMTKKGLKLDLELQAEPFDVDCDRERFLQVLGNLIGNAIKFTPDGGTISVRAECRTNETVISVTDTGIGIPADALAHVFERFWRVEKTGRRGTGLGLSIAQHLVQEHGGRIWAESTLGRGTTFAFTIPPTHRV